MFTSGRYTENWDRLMGLVDDGDWILLPVLEKHKENGVQSSPSKCAAAVMFKDYFGPNCRPWVEEDKRGELALSFSRPETRQRVQAIPLWKPTLRSKFSPQRFDHDKRGTKCGSFIVDGAAVRIRAMEERKEPREVRLKNAQEWKIRTGYASKPRIRKWSKELDRT